MGTSLTLSNSEVSYQSNSHSSKFIKKLTETIDTYFYIAVSENQQVTITNNDDTETIQVANCLSEASSLYIGPLETAIVTATSDSFIAIIGSGSVSIFVSEL